MSSLEGSWREKFGKILEDFGGEIEDPRPLTPEDAGHGLSTNCNSSAVSGLWQQRVNLGVLQPSLQPAA